MVFALKATSSAVVWVLLTTTVMERSLSLLLPTPAPPMTIPNRLYGSTFHRTQQPLVAFMVKGGQKTTGSDAIQNADNNNDGANQSDASNNAVSREKAKNLEVLEETDRLLERFGDQLEDIENLKKDGSSSKPLSVVTAAASVASGFDDGLQSRDDGFTANNDDDDNNTVRYGRISEKEYVLTPEQIAAFHAEGCIVVPNLLTDGEVRDLENVFDRFVSGEIPVPGKDFCDMSKPFGTPYEEWSLVNCMLPTKYYPPLEGNIYETLTQGIARQLFPSSQMTKDYDQLLNKRPGKSDAVFSWHQDMAYWPSSRDTLGVDSTDTCTFSLAIDDSDLENGCLRYVSGSGKNKALWEHKPAGGSTRDEGHALTTTVDDNVHKIRHAPAKRGSVTIHDEYVVHGSGGNNSPTRQRRTYVVAYRAREIVQAERKLGFTHSHNDEVNWDTFHEHQEKKQ